MLQRVVLGTWRACGRGNSIGFDFSSNSPTTQQSLQGVLSSNLIWLALIGFWFSSRWEAGVSRWIASRPASPSCSGGACLHLVRACTFSGHMYRCQHAPPARRSRWFLAQLSHTIRRCLVRAVPSSSRLTDSSRVRVRVRIRVRVRVRVLQVRTTRCKMAVRSVAPATAAYACDHHSRHHYHIAD